MKKIFLFAASALMIGALAISCNPEQKPEDETQGNTPEETPLEKSKAAKLLTFSVSNAGVTVVGEIFDTQKIVELQYKPEEAEVISNGTAEYTISEKATIAPDPATITDWSAEVKLTVTAEDGETANEYTVTAIAADYDVAIAPVEGDGNLLTAIGADNDIAFYGGNEIAFSGLDRIVTCDGRVYDLDFNYVGELNRGEIGEGSLMSMGNDDNGVLIIAVGYGDDAFSAAPVDGDGIITWNYTNSTRFYAWKDGWDKAPVKIYENGSRLMYMNVNGDLNGNMLIVAKQGANEGGAGNHHLFHFENGQVSGAKWAWFETGRAEIGLNAGEMNFTSALWRLGASAGSTVSPLGIDKADALFVYGQALSALSVEDPEYSADKWGKDGNSGMIVAARKGYQGTDMILRGTAETINGGTPRYGGYYGWGNVCITGDIKAFKYNGNVYAAVAGSNWNETHFTVLDITASTEGNTVALLSTQSDNKGNMGGGGLASVAYVYDPATETGHIAVLFATPGNEVSSSVRRFDLTRQKK